MKSQFAERWNLVFAWIFLILHFVGSVTHRSDAWQADTIGVGCFFLLLSIRERVSALCVRETT